MVVVSLSGSWVKSMGIQIRKKKICDWQGFELSTDTITLGIVPEIGGRLISLTYQGEELLFVQQEHQGETFSFAENLRAEKKRLGFRLWGGDKTWVSPQSAWWEAIPPLELDAGAYEARLEEGAIVMESPVCRETGLRIIRRIELQEGGRILLDQTLCNESTTTAHRGIWNVTQCLRPFTVWIPTKISAIRPYPAEGDSIKLLPKVVREKGDWSSIVCQDPLHFKFGALLDKGILIAFRENQGKTLLWTRSFSVEKEGTYAHNAAIEVYNSPTDCYCEIEVHAPFVPLKKGECVSHRQEWSFTSEQRAVQG